MASGPELRVDGSRPTSRCRHSTPCAPKTCKRPVEVDGWIRDALDRLDAGDWRGWVEATTEARGQFIQRHESQPGRGAVPRPTLSGPLVSTAPTRSAELTQRQERDHQTWVGRHEQQGRRLGAAARPGSAEAPCQRVTASTLGRRPRPDQQQTVLRCVAATLDGRRPWSKHRQRRRSRALTSLLCRRRHGSGTSWQPCKSVLRYTVDAAPSASR